MVIESTGFPELDQVLAETGENPPPKDDPLSSSPEPRTARSARGPSGDKEPAAKRASSRSISVRVRKQIGILGAGVDMLDRDDICGNTLMDNAEDIGIALENVAKENPRIAKLLDEGIESAAWINLFLVVAGTITPIARAHIRPRRRREVVEYVPEEEEFAGFAGNDSPVTPSESAAAAGGLPALGESLTYGKDAPFPL